jgi:hypothetical protein
LQNKTCVKFMIISLIIKVFEMYFILLSNRGEEWNRMKWTKLGSASCVWISSNQKKLFIYGMIYIVVCLFISVRMIFFIGCWLFSLFDIFSLHKQLNGLRTDSIASVPRLYWSFP